MNKILIFLLGAAVGGVGTYFFVKKKNDAEWNKFLKDLDAEKDIKEMESKLDENEKSLKEFTNQIKQQREEEQIEELSEDELKDYYMARLKELGFGVEERDTEEVNPVDDEEGPDEDGQFVYGIHKILYDTGKKEYTKEHLGYYRGDDTFVDLDTGEPIDNWAQHLGDAWYEELRIDPHAETIYIRNEALESDYEVTIMNGSFAGATGESEDEDDYEPGDMADKRR